MAAAAAPAEPLEYEMQHELSDIIIQGCISGLRREFEMKLCENQNHISALSKSGRQNLSAIAAVRDELANIVAAASDTSVKDDSEQPPVATQTNEAVHYIPEFSLLKHMSSEQIYTFLKSEWLKEGREHESELQKKTEEIFRLKREFAKDGAVLPFRKERELEFIKSKLLQTISKMDGIISRTEGSGCFDYNEDSEPCRLKDRIGSLLDENEHLRGLLSDKRMEAQQLSSQVVDAQSDVARRSLYEAKLLNRVEKLSDELEDLKTESYLKDLLELSVLTEVFRNYENQIDDRDQEECLLQELIMEKEEQLRVMSGDRHKLKYENDQLVSIVGSTLVQHQAKHPDPLPFPTYSAREAIFGRSRALQLAGGGPADSSPSAAAPAAGGRGIDGSRRVHSLGMRGCLPAALWSWRRGRRGFWRRRFPPLFLASPVEGLDRSAVLGAAAALRCRGALSFELVAMVVAPTPDLGFRRLPLWWGLVLLLNLSGRLQVRCFSSSVFLVGLRKMVGAVIFVSGARRRWWSGGGSAPMLVQRQDSGACVGWFMRRSQQGWLSFFHRCVVCVVVPGSSPVARPAVAFVRVCSVLL